MYVLPLYLLGLTLVGILLSFSGIGTVGEVVPNLMGFTFATLWTAVAAILSLVAAAVAVSQVKLSDKTLRIALRPRGADQPPGPRHGPVGLAADRSPGAARLPGLSQQPDTVAGP